MCQHNGKIYVPKLRHMALITRAAGAVVINVSIIGNLRYSKFQILITLGKKGIEICLNDFKHHDSTIFSLQANAVW